MSEAHHPAHERRILGTELLWAFGVGVLVAVLLGMIVFTALTQNINPPSNVERIDPKTLHLSGEFTEQNLGTSRRCRWQRDDADHRHPIRVRAALRCGPARPAGDAALCPPDVIHGILVTGTNVNTW